MVAGARILVLFLAGCGVEIGEPPDDETASGGKGDEDTPTPTPTTATQLFTRLGMQYCDECFRCQATYPDGPTEFADDFGAKSECYDDALEFYTPELVEQGITAGRIIFNPAAAKLCADGVRYEPSCAAFWQTEPTVPVACAAVFVGTVPDGGACVTDLDCSTTVARCDQTTKRCAR